MFADHWPFGQIRMIAGGWRFRDLVFIRLLGSLAHKLAVCVCGSAFAFPRLCSLIYPHYALQLQFLAPSHSHCSQKKYIRNEYIIIQTNGEVFY